MKIVLLGHSGQVGRELLRSLPPTGEVVCPSRQASDFRDTTELEVFIQRLKADVVINAAAYTAVDRAETEPDLAYIINAKAPGAIARACKLAGSKFIHFSTDYVFAGDKSDAYAESDVRAPLSVYGRTKAEGEDFVLESGAAALIFRTSWVHAAHGANFIRRILQLATERESLSVVSDQVGSPTSARHISEVIALAIHRLRSGADFASGTYHLTSTGSASWHDVAQFALGRAVELGWSSRMAPADIKAIPSHAYPTAAARPLNSRLNTHKLRSALDIDLPKWQIGVLQTVQDIVEVMQK